MQNRYTGDIGDFGKYGMLRELCKRRKLGVVWYLVPDERHNDDGNKIRYFDADNKAQYCKLDSTLYDSLRRIVKSGKRKVAEIRKRKILPTGTQFYEEHVPSGDRNEWLCKANKRVRGCDILFLDPDNGLQVKSVRVGSEKARKYVCWDDFNNFDSSPSLIIYQHRQHKQSETQIHEQTNTLRNKINGNRKIHALTFCPNPYKPDPKSDRIYYIIPAVNDFSLSEELKRYCGGEWKEHFKLRNSKL